MKSRLALASDRPPGPDPTMLRWLAALARAAAILSLAAAGCALARGQSHPWMDGYKGSQDCTVCHAGADHEIMSTTHWTWEHVDPKTGQKLGKRHMINNYCISLPTNEPRCTSCHVGWGYSDKNFNFNDATKVDCLVCHDTTGEYKKFPAGSGLPVTGQAKEFPAGSGVLWQPVDLAKVAQNVGRTSRATCGACHFFGGGGDAVKHGDLDSSLFNPSRKLDVHMGTDGKNFQCTDCHQTSNHRISGTRYAKDYTDNKLCEDCHTSKPHAKGGANAALDNHTGRVACQTCHIPLFARGRATKMDWDWSTAGKKDASGKNYVIKNAEGEPVYDTQKGDFVWEKDVVPEYVWFNGGATYVTLEDSVSPDEMVTINKLEGGLSDTNSRIFPVKRFTGKQPFDAGTGKLAMPHLFPLGATDTNAYWKVFDWSKALAAGMAGVDRSFSGNVGWVETEMFWIQNHMVAPKEDALSCSSCHVPQGRLNFAALGYPPERVQTLQTLMGFEVGAARLSAEPGKFRLKWTGRPGFKYRVQSSKDLKGWTEIAASERAAGGTAAELDWTEDLEATASSRFFRVVRIQQ